MATIILTPSIQSFEGSSDKVHPKTIWTTAHTIKILTIISSSASQTKAQNGGTGLTNTLLVP